MNVWGESFRGGTDSSGAGVGGLPTSEQSVLVPQVCIHRAAGGHGAPKLSGGRGYV